MIICDQFEGDNLDLARQQHDVYHEALGIIITGCRTHYLSACTILGLGEARYDEWCAKRSIDHRTVQDAHDILAAVWRHLVSPPDPCLYNEAVDAKPSTPNDWLEWLKCTVEQWNERPEIVRAFYKIFLEQNTDAGFKAERELAELLRERYKGIRWKRVLTDSGDE